MPKFTPPTNNPLQPAVAAGIDSPFTKLTVGDIISEPTINGSTTSKPTVNDTAVSKPTRIDHDVSKSMSNSGSGELKAGSCLLTETLEKSVGGSKVDSKVVSECKYECYVKGCAFPNTHNQAAHICAKCCGGCGGVQNCSSVGPTTEDVDSLLEFAGSIRLLWTDGASQFPHSRWYETNPKDGSLIEPSTDAKLNLVRAILNHTIITSDPMILTKGENLKKIMISFILESISTPKDKIINGS